MRQQGNRLGPARHDDVFALPPQQRQVTRHHDDIAESLFAVHQEPLPGERLALPAGFVEQAAVDVARRLRHSIAHLREAKTLGIISAREFHRCERKNRFNVLGVALVNKAPNPVDLIEAAGLEIDSVGVDRQRGAVQPPLQCKIVVFQRLLDIPPRSERDVAREYQEVSLVEILIPFRLEPLEQGVPLVEAVRKVAVDDGRLLKRSKSASARPLDTTLS